LGIGLEHAVKHHLKGKSVDVYSAEFLLGPHLANNLLNPGVTEAAREAMSGLGYDL
jgi:starch phosphorylase